MLQRTIDTCCCTYNTLFPPLFIRFISSFIRSFDDNLFNDKLYLDGGGRGGREREGACYDKRMGK